MNRLTAAAMVLAILTAVTAWPAWAHHSFAMYDQSKTQTLTGRLTRFIPGANHAQLIFEVVDNEGNPVVEANGQPVVWGVETGPAAMIARQGITVKSFPVGTILTVTLNPLRDGRPFGSLSGAIIKCGSKMPEGGCTAGTGEAFLNRGPAGTPAPD